MRCKKIMDEFENQEEWMSHELKKQAGFYKGGEKNFNGMITEFQMQTYLIIRDFRQKRNKKEDIDLRICGGANIIHPLVQAGLIDEYCISIIPTLLGSGIRLWGEIEKELKLKLVRIQSCNGIIELYYRRR